MSLQNIVYSVLERIKFTDSDRPVRKAELKIVSVAGTHQRGERHQVGPAGQVLGLLQ